ncbi:MAG: cysteine desulfurase family protein [Candidatus Wukongarchaeota archaeon]|nr:cysteine desulfurase family protein [Candidatus Wukongarchaeota archaeon]
MDYQAGMPIDPIVFETMKPYFTENFGNPSSLHYLSQPVKEALTNARQKIAELINAETPKKEIIFTSGGTESINMAIKGAALRNKNEGNHIITSSIEHMATLNSCKSLMKEGFNITFLPVDEHGIVDIESLKEAITDKTILISIMYANNEIGTIEPIKEIGEIAGDKKIYFHTDAVAAAGKIPIDVQEENIGLMTLSSNDIYGPKGVGALYVNKRVKVTPIIHGGGQERGLRSGTENIPGIVGFGKAAELAKENMEDEIKHTTELRDMLIKNILEKIERSYLTGHFVKRMPNNASFRFDGIEGESIVLKLSQKGIVASTGSACASQTLEPSHVLRATGLSHVEAHGSLLLTLSKWNTVEDVNYLLEEVPKIVSGLREISPLWQMIVQGVDLESKMQEWMEGMKEEEHHHHHDENSL